MERERAKQTGRDTMMPPIGMNIYYCIMCDGAKRPVFYSLSISTCCALGQGNQVPELSP